MGDSNSVDDCRRTAFANCRRMVIKVGSAVLTSPAGELDTERIRHIVHQIHELGRRGIQSVVVTSGAISAGWHELGFERRPTSMPQLQASAAVGQGKLISIYDQFLSKLGRHAGQVLLTREDFENRRRYLNARNTIWALLERGSIPIINENDTISVEEITFGDNDILSAQVTHLVQAEVLVILSTVDGLYKGKPCSGGKPEVISRVGSVSEAMQMVFDETSKGGTGGMDSKLQAAAMATEFGEAVIIANGRESDVLLRLVGGEPLGTLFMPSPRRLSSRKRWIGFTALPRGRILVDPGAQEALRKRGKSLLATGVVGLDGDFHQGDVVSISTPDGPEFARGLTNYSADELKRIKGLRTSAIAKVLGSKPYDEVVHRDNMVVLRVEATGRVDSHQDEV